MKAGSGSESCHANARLTASWATEERQNAGLRYEAEADHVNVDALGTAAGGELRQDAAQGDRYNGWVRGIWRDEACRMRTPRQMAAMVFHSIMACSSANVAIMQS